MVSREWSKKMGTRESWGYSPRLASPQHSRVPIFLLHSRRSARSLLTKHKWYLLAELEALFPLQAKVEHFITPSLIIFQSIRKIEDLMYLEFQSVYNMVPIGWVRLWYNQYLLSAVYANFTIILPLAYSIFFSLSFSLQSWQYKRPVQD